MHPSAGRLALNAFDAPYRALFDAANDAMFVHDPVTGAILDVNRRMTKMYGMTRKEALRLSVEDLSAGIAPYTQALALDRLREAVAGRPQLFEWLAKDRAGRLFWVEVNLQRVDIGRKHRLLAIVRDITERKRSDRLLREAHDSQTTLNALLQLALADLNLEELLRHALALLLNRPWPATVGTGAIFLMDEAGEHLQLKAHNGLDSQMRERCARVRAGRCLCGATINAGTLRHCTGLDDPDDAVSGMASGHYCMPVAAGEKILGVIDLCLEPGHPCDGSEQAFLAAFASTLAVIIMRKRGEKSLRAAAEQLRDQAALVRLGEMAALVAHEVKNPLAGVRGAIQVIGRRLPPESKDAAVVGDVIARIDALNELVNDLLLFARPPQAQQELTDLVALAQETSLVLGQDPVARDVRFKVEGSAPLVMADPKLLKIVLGNLFLNAADAMKHEGTIRTAISVSDGICRIAVADSGPGIPSDIRDRIFEPFFTTKARGTGIGLATAKRLVEVHQGRIGVDCPPAGGTVVTIELPAVP